MNEKWRSEAMGSKLSRWLGKILLLMAINSQETVGHAFMLQF